MTQKIIYFTAGAVPTSEELLEIAGLNDAAAAKYVVAVRRGDTQVSQSYGAGIEDCDFVAGTTVPSAYSAYTVFDVDAEPITVGEDDEITVSNSAGSNTTTSTAVITDGVLVATLAATDQIVTDTDTVVVKNSAGSVSKNGTATVASGLISGVALASTEAIVSNTGTVVVTNSAASVTKNGTAAVASGLVTAVALAATEAIVSNGDTPTITDAAGTTSTAARVVGSGVVSSTTLASTDKIIKSTVQVPCPAPTGVRTTGYVFTIVNGAITAAVGY